MLVYEDINLLCKQMIRYIGNGYKYVKTNKIPENKMYKIKKIEEKITKKYNTDLTVWQRQYKRRKGIANFISLRYKDLIIILKTNGETHIQDKFNDVVRAEFHFTNYLQLQLIKDERNKLTYKLTKEIYRDKKEKLKIAIKTRNKQQFNKEIYKLSNLNKYLKYRGISVQISSILKMIKQEQKEHGTHFNVPKFF